MKAIRSFPLNIYVDFHASRRRTFGVSRSELVKILDEAAAILIRNFADVVDITCDIRFLNLLPDSDIPLTFYNEVVVTTRGIPLKGQRVIYVEPSLLIKGLARSRSSLREYFVTTLTSHVFSVFDFASKSDTFQDDTQEGLPTPDWSTLGAFVEDRANSLLAARDGRVALADTSASGAEINPRIEAARIAIDDLIDACRRGNQQHAELGDFSRRYKGELERIETIKSGLAWHITALKIELYQSNYGAAVRRKPEEYPPFEPAFASLVDAVIVASAQLARAFPEIAKAQDDLRKYSNRQTRSRQALQEMVNPALSTLALAENIFTPETAPIAKQIAELEVSDADSEEAERVAAVKTGFFRDYLGAIADWALRATHNQARNLGDNVRTKGVYDISKEIIKALTDGGFTSHLAVISTMSSSLAALASEWPAMFNFGLPLLRLLGLIH